MLIFFVTFASTKEVVPTTVNQKHSILSDFKGTYRAGMDIVSAEPVLLFHFM